MATVDALIQPFVDAATMQEAEAVLDRLADEGVVPAQTLGDCYDELAEYAANERDVASAARLERRAVQLGCRDRFLAREMLAWYLLESGEVDEGESLFAALRRQRPTNVELVIGLANARSASGRREAALEAFDEAVALAKLVGDAPELDRARIERRAEREHNGLPPDEDDRLTPAPRPLRPPVELAVAWFPPGERDAAGTRWPELADDFADPVAYCRGIEARLRALRQRTGQAPRIAALSVDGLVAWSATRGIEPDSGLARSGCAAELSRTGRALDWPPSRNEPCWCGGGIKYKRCCGR